MLSKEQFDTLYKEFLKNVRKAHREVLKDEDPKAGRGYESKSYQYTDISDSIARVMTGAK